MEHETVDLTLKLSPKTLKKFRALAMLSGLTVTQLEEQFTEIFDQMMTDNLLQLIEGLDGKKFSIATSAQEVVSQERPRSFAGVEQETHDAPEEVDVNSHQLSVDDDVGETKSAEEIFSEPKKPAEVAEEPTVPEFAQTAFAASVQDAGNNAEAFLDAAMSSVQKNKSNGGARPTTRSPRPGFDPKNPRVTISEHTGDDEVQPHFFS